MQRVKRKYNLNIDLTGTRVGKLTVQTKGPQAKYNHARWYCLCDCGNTDQEFESWIERCALARGFKK